MLFSNYEEQNSDLKNFKKTHETDKKKFIHTNFESLNVGDIIYIEFYPYSQKFIDELCPLFGTIKEIKKTIPSFGDSDMVFDNLTIERLVLTSNGETFNGFHYWTSYYGNTRGYEYSIYKLNDIIDEKKNEYYISSDEEIINNLSSDSPDELFSKINNSIDQNISNTINDPNKKRKLKH